MIHAYAAPAAGQALETFDYPDPELRDNDVEITIECCGLCRSDLHLNKEQEANKLGADHFLALTDTESLKKAVGSFHFMLVTASADLDWAALGMLLRPFGKLCFIGLPPSDIKIPARLLVSGSRYICGSGTGSRARMKEMLEFCARRHIQAQVEAFPMQKINEAIQRLKSNQARYRIVLTNSP